MNDALKLLLPHCKSYNKHIAVFEIPNGVFSFQQLWEAFSPTDKYWSNERLDNNERRYTMRHGSNSSIYFQLKVWNRDLEKLIATP